MFHASLADACLQLLPSITYGKLSNHVFFFYFVTIAETSNWVISNSHDFSVSLSLSKFVMKSSTDSNLSSLSSSFKVAYLSS